MGKGAVGAIGFVEYTAQKASCIGIVLRLGRLFEQLLMQLPTASIGQGADYLLITQHLGLKLTQLDCLLRSDYTVHFPVDQVTAAMVFRKCPWRGRRTTLGRLGRRNDAGELACRRVPPWSRLGRPAAQEKLLDGVALRLQGNVVTLDSLYSSNSKEITLIV